MKSHAEKVGKVWVVNPVSGDLTVGRFRVRLVRNGPLVPCEVVERVPRDDENNVCGDAEYVVMLNGDLIADPRSRWPEGLIGEPDPLPTVTTPAGGEKIDLLKIRLPF